MRFPRHLQDRFGHAYRIDFASSHEFWAIRVWDGHLPAAYLYAWHVRGRGLRIQDFKVADDLRVPEPVWPALLRKLFGFPPRIISYRRRGIATALLSMVVTRADAAGIPRIEGDIVALDQTRFPGLPEWYRDRGFALQRDAHGLRFYRNATPQSNAIASSL